MAYYDNLSHQIKIISDFESSDTQNSTKAKKNGLGVISAAVFISSEMAGTGILALPRAVVDCGWIGLILLIVFCVHACIGGCRLTTCWEILEERYPEYRRANRNPYPTIAEKAVGRWGRILVSICIQITLFGAGIVFLLLASQSFQELLRPLQPDVTFCVWFFLYAIIITPPIWLGSPKDFLLVVVVGALLSTAIACILLCTQILLEGIEKTAPVIHKPHTFMDFFFSFGIIIFPFSGSFTFPTIKNDMKNMNNFSKSVWLGVFFVLVLYLPLSGVGYFVYGEDTNANIALNVRLGYLVIVTNVCMVLHFILAFLIVISPVAQAIENIFDVPHEFCMLRCVIRTCMILFMLMLGETVPQFSKILSLIGGSTVTLLTFILPNFFYMKLCDQNSPAWPKSNFIAPIAINDETVNQAIN